MSILPKLQSTNCRIGSASGKELAKDVLAGNHVILKEAINLVTFDDKNVRVGAAKIIEKAAEEKTGVSRI
ncbi:MAG: hypothetical protein GY730_02800 [bacterium]|nr:hypothetical protein [bacterium]